VIRQSAALRPSAFGALVEPASGHHTLGERSRRTAQAVDCGIC
jgi:hypothetical protein